MPSIVTHHLFAKDVLKKEKLNVNPQLFYIFAQSFDNLFYYKFFTPFLGQEIRTLGTTGQRQKINLYFKNIILEISQNHLENNPDALAYLYGSLAHYILDSTCHPFIIYYSGITSVNKKYRGGHEKMEIMLDAIMYHQKTNHMLKDSHIANYLLPKLKFSKDLKNLLDNVFEKTFNISNIGNIYNKSYLTGHFIIKYFVTDTTGIKKQFYKIIDSLGTKRMYQHLSFHISTLDTSILNLNHQTWTYPTNKTIHKNLSFYELYDEAQTKLITLIHGVNSYFNKDLSLSKLLKMIGNNSYSTGLDYQDNKPFKYFFN